MRPGSGMSVRAKAVLAAAGTVASAFALCMVVLVLAVQHNLRASADLDAKQTAAALTDQLSHGAIGPDTATMVAAPEQVTIRDTAGCMVAATADYGADASATCPERPGSAGSGAASAYKVQVAPSTTALDNATGLLLRQVAPSAAGLALFVAALTWWLVGRALRPVAAIRREFTEITERDLHRRVPVPRARDEIHRLARTMNSTLDRLHRAMTRQRQFVTDASHELRGPIAAVRAQLELVLARPSRTDWANGVHKALQDTDRLQAVASDLLLLARLDAQEAPPTAAVDLTALAAEEVRRLPDTVTLVESWDEAVVTGSRVRLSRLLTNLTDNARRHARTTVSVAVRAEDGMVELTVDDDGPGIPEGDRERVFERFTRLDDARARRDGGTGLGLAIARDIALTHGGTLTAHAGPLGGARMRLRLPHVRAAVKS